MKVFACGCRHVNTYYSVHMKCSENICTPLGFSNYLSKTETSTILFNIKNTAYCTYQGSFMNSNNYILT